MRLREEAEDAEKEKVLKGLGMLRDATEMEKATTAGYGRDVGREREREREKSGIGRKENKETNLPTRVKLSNTDFLFFVSCIFLHLK